MPDRHLRRTGSDYRDAFLQLLPEGQAWPKRAIDGVLWRTVDGLNFYWGHVDGRAADLLEIESDPRKTHELLIDWERNWGLPDPCEVDPSTDEGIRRLKLVAKMILLGEQSRRFFIDIAAEYGYVIHIREWSPYTTGLSEIGDTRGVYDSDNPDTYRWELAAPEIRYYWMIRVEGVDVFQFHCNDEETGQTGINRLLDFIIPEDLQCIIERLKPAHTRIIWAPYILEEVVGTIPVNVMRPTVSGIPVVGQIVSCTTGTWSGTPRPTYTFQWMQSPDTVIPDATEETYRLVTNDSNQTLYCIVTATNPIDSASIGSSNAIGPVIETIGDMAVTETGADVFFGRGITLSPLTGAMDVTETGADSFVGSGISYASLTGELFVNETGADSFVGSGATFLILTGAMDVTETGADTLVGSAVANVDGTLDTTETTNDAFVGVGGDQPPINMVAPAVTGTGYVNDLLSCDTGQWFGDPTYYAYQWYKDSAVIIDGAVTSSYMPLPGDLGSTIYCAVLATNGIGTSPPAQSNIKGPIAYPALDGSMDITELYTDVFEGIGEVRLPIDGTMDVTEVGADTFASSLTTEIIGNMSGVENPDSFVSSGTVLIDGFMAVTEVGEDGFAASGIVFNPGIDGTMAVQEVGEDSFASAGTVLWPDLTGSMAVTETGADSFVGSGGPVVGASLTVTEVGADSFAGSGTLTIDGAPIDVTEPGADSFAGSGGVEAAGAMGVTETGADSFASSGTVVAELETVYTTVGTQTVSVPAGYVAVEIECIGAGGPGCIGGASGSGGGGGGGAYSKRWVMSLGGITSLWLSVPGQSTENTTTLGGDAVVRANTSSGQIQCLAKGGWYGSQDGSGGGNGGSASSSTGDLKWDGGFGGLYDSNAGGGGSAAWNGGVGNNATSNSGAPSPGAPAGAGGNVDQNGLNYGGGGGTYTGNIAGVGKGAQGWIKLKWLPNRTVTLGTSEEFTGVGSRSVLVPTNATTVTIECIGAGGGGGGSGGEGAGAGAGGGSYARKNNLSLSGITAIWGSISAGGAPALGAQSTIVRSNVSTGTIVCQAASGGAGGSDGGGGGTGGSSSGNIGDVKYSGGNGDADYGPGGGGGSAAGSSGAGNNASGATGGASPGYPAGAGGSGASPLGKNYGGGGACANGGIPTAGAQGYIRLTWN